MLSLLLLLNLSASPAASPVSPGEACDTLPQPLEISVEPNESDLDVLRNLGARYSIVRPAPGMTYLYRYNCGGDSLTDVHGNLWMGDDTRFSRCWASHPDYPLDGMTPVYGTYGMAEDTVTVKAQSASMYVDMLEQPLLGTYRFGRSDLGFRFPVSSYQSYSVELYLLCMPCAPQNSSWVEFRFNRQVGRMPIIATNGVGSHSRVGKCSFLVHSDSLDYIDISVLKGRAVISAIAISTLPEIAAMSDEVPHPEGQGFPYSEGLNWAQLRQQALADPEKNR